MAESKGFFRRTPVHLRVASLLDHVGKNSPPDCFLPQTVSAPSLFESLYFFSMQKAGLATCFSFWRRARDFFGALPCSFASLCSLTPSAKTVHRTVFFRRLRLLPPCSNPSFCLTNSPNFIRNYFMGVQLRFREVALLYRNHEIDLLPGIKIPPGINPRWYDKRDLLVK